MQKLSREPKNSLVGKKEETKGSSLFILVQSTMRGPHHKGSKFISVSFFLMGAETQPTFLGVKSSFSLLFAKQKGWESSADEKVA